MPCLFPIKSWEIHQWVLQERQIVQYKFNSESHSVISNSLQPHGLIQQSMEFSRPGYWSGQPLPSPGIFPTQGSNSGLPHCRQIYLPDEPQGKPKNTGVGSLSLLQRIFPTLESNSGFLNRRQIFYQLSYISLMENGKNKELKLSWMSLLKCKQVPGTTEPGLIK